MKRDLIYDSINAKFQSINLKPKACIICIYYIPIEIINCENLIIY